MPEPTHFINVDLDLSSSESLGPLLDAWEHDVMVLHHTRVPGGGSEVGLEVAAMTTAAPPTIRCFVRLVQRLEPGLRALWDGCTERVLDIGIQSGTDGLHSWRLVLSPKVLAEVQEIGAQLAVTVYSPYEGDSFTPTPRPAPTHRSLKRSRKRPAG